MSIHIPLSKESNRFSKKEEAYNTSSEHPTVVTTAAVKYDRVIIGICLYHSSTAWAMPNRIQSRSQRAIEPRDSLYSKPNRISRSFEFSKATDIKMIQRFASLFFLCLDNKYSFRILKYNSFNEWHSACIKRTNHKRLLTPASLRSKITSRRFHLLRNGMTSLPNKVNRHDFDENTSVPIRAEHKIWNPESELNPNRKTLSVIWYKM